MCLPRTSRSTCTFRCRLQPEFFVDRSLGRHQVVAVLRAHGWEIVTHHEVYSARDEEVPDVEWLEHCADHELVVLSKDRRLRYRPDEIAVIRDRGLNVLVLARGNLASALQAQRLIASESAIREAVALPGPSVWVVYADGIEKIFPKG